MKPVEIRLPQEQDKSFIYFHDKQPWVGWHNHVEYELCLIIKGKGKRMIGDNIDRFEENDLIFLGPYLPHEWLCDEEYFNQPGSFGGECIVIQFCEDFLGNSFLDLPENKRLKYVFSQAARGCKITGQPYKEIVSILKKTTSMNNTEKLYALLSIFNILAQRPDYQVLASPSFVESFQSKENEPIKKVVQYILQNFHKDIRIKTLLEIANMSNTAFCMAFKKTYLMTFQEYIKVVRVGYACRLLTEGIKRISEIAFSAGFENLSNFNRQFRDIKGITPSQFKSQVSKM